MTKFYFISLGVVVVLWGITAALAVYRGYKIEQQNIIINNLNANVDVLIKGRKKDYADKVEIAKRNAELEEAAKNDEDCFTWNTDISNSPVMRKLRQN